MAHPSVPLRERLVLRLGGWWMLRPLMVKVSASASGRWLAGRSDARNYAMLSAGLANHAPVAGRLPAHPMPAVCPCPELAVPPLTTDPPRLPRTPRPPHLQGLRITPENGEACLGTIRRVFDSVAARLADGRRYLAGDAFTAADLTFACLAAPALAQPYNGATPGLDSPDIPPAMREQVQALRAHPAGRFALRLWAEERGVRVAQGQGAAEEAARPPARM